jgi:hypothetical protein
LHPGHGAAAAGGVAALVAGIAPPAVEAGKTLPATPTSPAPPAFTQAAPSGRTYPQR